MVFDYLCGVKRWFYIGIVLMMAVVGCTPPDPLLEGEGLPHEVCLELAEIDSLMWRQPDSAFAMLQEFASSAAADSLDEFNGHYCQMLIAELLFKNDYGQSNREEVLKAVHYFDSIVGMDGADARGASVQGRNAFLAARAHYMNGVGYYEHDSVVAACGEYLKALEMVETHFPNVETVCTPSLPIAHLPRFIALTYNRLGDLFKDMFMQNAIYCYKKSLVFTSIEPTSPNGMAKLLSSLGQQYHFLYQYDSAEYYLDEALKHLFDTNNLAYRDIISQKALLNYNMGKGIESSVNELRRMAAKAFGTNERTTRFIPIGDIYFDAQIYDSALVYLTQVFENTDDVLLKWDFAGKLRNIYQSRGRFVEGCPICPLSVGKCYFWSGKQRTSLTT